MNRSVNGPFDTPVTFHGPHRNILSLRVILLNSKPSEPWSESAMRVRRPGGGDGGLSFFFAFPSSCTVCLTQDRVQNEISLSDAQKNQHAHVACILQNVQGGWGGWPTGNGKKLSSSQAQLGQATCLAVA